MACWRFWLPFFQPLRAMRKVSAPRPSAWAKAAGSEREAFLTAYQQRIQSGMAQLSSADTQLERFVAQCADRNDLPRLWAQEVVASVAIQDGAATTLLASLKVPRAALDAAWVEAPAAPRDCARANAAKVFGVTGPTCPDVGAPVWFLQHLGISLATDCANATQVLYYFNAKAQQEWGGGTGCQVR